MYKIENTYEADIDLRNIMDYIPYEFKMPQVGIKLIERLQLKKILFLVLQKDIKSMTNHLGKKEN